MNDASPLPRVTRRQDYEPIVKALRPWMAGEELELRTSLMLMRDRATAIKDVVCEPAWHLFSVVERVAQDNATNYRIPLAELREIRNLCAQTVMLARGFDRVFQPILPGLDEGEADAEHG